VLQLAHVIKLAQRDPRLCAARRREMKQTLVIRLTFAAFAVAFLAAVGQSTALSGTTVNCPEPGAWLNTADAAWTVRVIAASGFKRIGCTGSALVIDTRGVGRSGHDLYVSASRSRTLPKYGSQLATIEGVLIHYDRLRAVWRARARNVWIEAGPSTPKLPPLRRLRPLIRASATTR
jgi:hypothetical protein